MKRIHIMLLLAAALMAGACAALDDVTPRPGETMPVALKAAVRGITPGSTRAAATTTTQDTELLDGERVDAYIYLSDGTTPLDAGTTPLQLQANGAGGNLVPVSVSEQKHYYPADGSAVKIFAVHPAVASGAPFAVATDQTDEIDFAASDLCYSATDSYTKQLAAHTLTFQHVLAKIVINITNTYNADLPTVAHLQAATATAITYPTGTGEDYSLDAASASHAIKLALAAGTGSAIIPPQTLYARVGFIYFDIDGLGRIVYELPATTTFESGKKYTYNITVSTLGVSAVTSIADWNADVADQSLGGTGTVNRPVLPIEYVAPYNMQTATAMAADNLKSHSMYFSWSSSSTLTPKADIQAMINGTAVPGYHLPSKAEMCSVIAPFFGAAKDPSMGGDNNVRMTYGGGQHLNMKERLAWGMVNANTSSTWTDENYTYIVDKDFYNDYNCPSGIGSVGYALRFKDMDGSDYVNGLYTCAYRYEYKATDTTIGSVPSLTVKVIYVGPDSSITISTISNESWWSAPEYTVVFPGFGYTAADGANKNPGYTPVYDTSYGCYWLASKYNASWASYMNFNASYVHGNNANLPTYGFSIRLFKDGDATADTGVAFSNVTSAHVGYFIAQDGKAYRTKAGAAAHGTTAVGVICYAGSVNKYFTKFVAIALEDADASEVNWTTTQTRVNTYASSHPVTVGSTTYNTMNMQSTGHDGFANGTSNSSQARTGELKQGWRVPSVTDWRYIFQGLGGPSATSPVGVASSGTYGSGSTLQGYINAACGNSALTDGQYWTSSVLSTDTNYAWGYSFTEGESMFFYSNKTYSRHIRAVFAY